MSELKDIVPSLELCKPIPETDFEETVMVWAEWRPVYGELGPVVAIRSEVSSRANVDIIAPAPTPTEILASLPLGTIIMQDEPGVWVCIAPTGAIVRKSDNPAHAALKVWFKINNIEVQVDGERINAERVICTRKEACIMNNELKPCPFCGGELELVESIVTETTAEPASAICPICRFRYVTDLILENTGRYSESGFDEVSMRNSDRALIQAVNRRPIESSLIERLNEQRRYTEQAVAEVDRLRAENAELKARVVALKKELAEKISEETSDGYHTFKELYHHRAVLFSALCKCYPEKAWKARKHHDGTMFENMFICGIDTPDGQATYHYDIDPYWNMFPVKELESAPEWDGHTSEVAIEHIAQLFPPNTPNEPAKIAELNKKLEATVEALEIIKAYGNCFGYRIGDPNPYAKVVGALKKARGE